MKTNNYEEIVFNRPKNWGNVKKEQKLCKAFDTETLNGYSFLLSDSEKNISTCDIKGLRIEGNIELNNFNHMMEMLYSNEETLNVFYNLGYDNDAIIKHIPYDNLKQYAHIGYTIFDGWYISGIPKKSIDIARAIEIKDLIFLDGKYNLEFITGEIKSYKKRPVIYLNPENIRFVVTRKVKFFDIYQFFKYEKNASLDNVSKKYLGAMKTDIEFFGYSKSCLPLDDIIIGYCNQDCELTKKLCDIVIKACNDIGLIFNTPYSCATIAADYFFTFSGLTNPNNFLYQYGKNVSAKNKDIFRYAYYAYKGGRTEVCKRGTFETCHEYDVNSMYPYNMTKIYNIFKCDWIRIIEDKEFYNYDLNNMAYAFLNCDIKMNDNYINPLPFKHNGFYIYGHGNFNNYTISLSEYIMIKDLNLGEIKINNGWIGLKTSDNNEDYPFKDIIEKTFNQRNLFKKSDFRNSLLKIILNSIYGRFIEVNINKDLDDNINLYSDDYIITESDIYKKGFYAGKYFCPIYACEITALSRVMLYREAYKNEPEHNFIGSFTDSILSIEPLKNIDKGRLLGQWEYDKGELTIVGSGVYRFRSDNINTDEKLRTRGIHVKESINNMFGFNDFSLENILSYGVDQTKVQKLKESLIQDKMENFNTFVIQHKDVNLNFDKKRIWDYDFKSVDDIKNKCFSQSININDIKKL